MSYQRFLVELTPAERTYLQQLIACGSPKTQAWQRAQIWLLCDQGPEGPAGTDAQPAEAVAVTARTVYRARQALVWEGLAAALQREPRPPRPPKLDGTAQADLVWLACSAPPPGHALWTMKLLAAELVALEVVDSIAPETVRRVLQKRVEAVAETLLVYSPAGQRRLRTQHGGCAGSLSPAPDDRRPVVCVDETSQQLVVAADPGKRN